jgi:hypothetical protein
MAKDGKKERKTKINEIVTRDYTIHLHKRIHDRCAGTREQRAGEARQVSQACAQPSVPDAPGAPNLGDVPSGVTGRMHGP